MNKRSVEDLRQEKKTQNLCPLSVQHHMQWMSTDTNFHRFKTMLNNMVWNGCRLCHRVFFSLSLFAFPVISLIVRWHNTIFLNDWNGYISDFVSFSSFLVFIFVPIILFNNKKWNGQDAYMLSISFGYY